ncbi:Transcriptional regulator, AbiEi antitoxin, Type IV TA system [Nocardioides alpinus]|uniref:Transcriptional regulator, AbiEi antitoxin, Type IV TA system n=1 Tax=Nocardioides alpinus TaxID=748909 RepID=A0A1I1BBC8_9ACTN|nr:type IV toxin-antitoxin system AbiEi family antitoxin domain-containing protein [Nocardioides alpinus]PKH40492.1 hypothetical protein CXG46_12740 [Nocardioides alpinus]SFB47072.1 Transcriptional regulator, AbiEi antitoxin, Type IV TA system [Nocardioides alpinus]
MDTNDAFPIGTHDISLRRELIAAGWTDRDIARAVRSGLIHRVRYGAYVDAKLWRMLDSDRDRHRARSRAVLRTAHPSSVLTHQSALAEHIDLLWRLCLDDVALTRTDGVAGRHESGIVHHSGGLHLPDITVRNGVPVSTPPRTAIEILSTHDTELGLCLLNALLHTGRTTLDEVRAVAARTEHWPHTLAVRIAIGLADPRLSSIAESRTFHLFYRENVPLPVPQVDVHDALGTLLGCVDFLWPKQGVFLEFDGRIKYELFRRPGETLADYLMREKKREERICQETGWICIRIGWSDLENPQATARRILAILDKRAPTAA